MSETKQSTSTCSRSYDFHRNKRAEGHWKGDPFSRDWDVSLAKGAAGINFLLFQVTHLLWDCQKTSLNKLDS